MKTAILVLSIILLVATAGLGLLASKKGFGDAKDIDSVYTSMKGEITNLAHSGDKDAQEMQSLGESTTKMRVGAGLMAVAGLLALALIAMLFVRKGVGPLAIGVVSSAILAIVLCPQYDTGPLGGASARTLAYVLAALGAVASAAAFGAHAARRAARQG